jgi:predicted transcriptional regulator of viral defense system
VRRPRKRALAIQGTNLRHLRVRDLIWPHRSRFGAQNRKISGFAPYNGCMSEPVTSNRPSRTLLEQAHRRRRRTIHTGVDREWLSEITPAPQDLLHAMRKAGLLHHAAAGRYVLATPGASSLAQNASPELLVDLVMRPRPYYVGFLSALIAHRLTDLHTTQMTVAVPQGTRVRGRLPIDLKLVQISATRWPEGQELKRVRTLPGTKEFVFRSSLERTLVDVLSRPDLSAGFETVALSWRRALDRSDVSWTEVARIAQRHGDASSRRTAFMLRKLGLDEVADRQFGGLEGRRTSTLLDRSQGFSVSKPPRDRDTGVVINLPPGYLRGWLAGEVG